jgi:hypothetical protein
MSKLIDAIIEANATLTDAGLPRYDELVELLRAAENKLEAMQRYHSGSTAQSIFAFRSKINVALANFPYP